MDDKLMDMPKVGENKYGFCRKVHKDVKHRVQIRNP